MLIRLLTWRLIERGGHAALQSGVIGQPRQVRSRPPEADRDAAHAQGAVQSTQVTVVSEASAASSGSATMRPFGRPVPCDRAVAHSAAM